MAQHWFSALLILLTVSGCPRRETAGSPVWFDRPEVASEIAGQVEQVEPDTATTVEIAALPTEAPEPIAPPEEPAKSAEPVEPVGLRLCAVPAALKFDPTLDEILDAVAAHWTAEGISVVRSTAAQGCEALIDIGERSLAESGEWGTKDAQTWLPKTMSEQNPAITRFRQGFWTDPLTTQPLRAALAAHEVGHILLGPKHDPELGELMSEVVSDTLADKLFGDMFEE